MGILEQGSRRRQPQTEPARPRDVPVVSQDMMALLSAEERERIRQEAIELAAERKHKAAKDAFLNQCVEEELRKFEPQHATREILIDLAPHSKEIRLDNRVYIHGGVYAVPMPVYYTLQEIISRSWAHDRAVGSPNRDVYRPVSQVAGQNFMGDQFMQRSVHLTPSTVDGALMHQRARMHG